MDSGGKNLSILTKCNNNCLNAVWSPDGNYIAFTERSNYSCDGDSCMSKIVFMKSDGTNLVYLPQKGIDPIFRP